MAALNYHDFPHPATDLSAFLTSLDFFIIALKDGRTIHHFPKDIEGFRAWLESNNIRDIEKDKGIPKDYLYEERKPKRDRRNR